MPHSSAKLRPKASFAIFKYTTMSSFASAIKAYNDRDFARALSLFHAVGQKYGTELVQANIELCRREIERSSSIVRQPTASQAVTSRTALPTIAVEKAPRGMVTVKGQNLTRESPQPSLSIIVPVHNTAGYLSQCIDSILQQSHRDFELILVDDGSTDESPVILADALQRDDRIVLISNALASGNPGTPRNQALSIARGEYIGFVDSDDWIEPHFYKELVDAANISHAEIAFSGGFNNHTNRGIEVRKYGKNFFNAVGSLFHRYHESFMIWDKIFSRDLLVRHNIRMGETKAAVDVPFIFKAYHHANFAEICHELVGYNYRRETPTSVTVNQRRGSACDFEFRAYADIDEWSRNCNATAQLRNIISIKKVTSFIYTLSLVNALDFKDVYERTKEAFRQIDRNIIERFSTEAGKRWIINKFDAIIRLDAENYFNETRKAEENSIDVREKSKFYLRGERAGIAFFPTWVKSNPYQELFYSAINKSTLTSFDHTSTTYISTGFIRSLMTNQPARAGFLRPWHTQRK
jgi:glycosyltransferase involved in cell wall biosynthesis